jgi:hypothetical protein
MIKNITIVALCICLSGCWTISEGQKNGYIVKVAKVGGAWGTYEGELIRGGFDNGTGVNGRSFMFSIGAFHNTLVKKIEKALNNNKPVTIKYKCEAFVAPWRGKENCFVHEVKEHV